MKFQRHFTRFAYFTVVLQCFLAVVPFGFSQSQQMPTGSMAKPALAPSLESRETTPPQSDVTLAELEQMALSSNPTLAQAAAEVRAASARKQQAGLYPNPTIGYQGEQIRGGIQSGGEQGFFVSQNIVLGGKLELSRDVAEQERKQAEAKADEQRQRVINSVRISYYRALAAQEMAEVRRKLRQAANDAAQTSRQLFNVGQADQPDVLQEELEVDQAELAVVAAEHNQLRTWTALTATVGKPGMPLAHLSGNLSDLPEGNADQWLQAAIDESPAVRLARLGVTRAEAALARSKRESTPDLQIRGGLEQNRELSTTTGRAIGLQGFVEAGFQIPIFNRNQGNVAASKADVERAHQEVQRIQLRLNEQGETLFQTYITSRAMVERYHDRMIPRAQKAYSLYLTKYQAMAAAYPQVLIAQRTLFQLQADYITALENVWTNSIALQGFLLTDGLESPGGTGETDGSLRETSLPGAVMQQR